MWGSRWRKSRDPLMMMWRRRWRAWAGRKDTLHAVQQRRRRFRTGRGRKDTLRAVQQGRRSSPLVSWSRV